MLYDHTNVGLSLASGNSDHTSASAPVTNGVSLVPPEIVAVPPVLRRVMESPGALRPPLIERLRQRAFTPCGWTQRESRAHIQQACACIEALDQIHGMRSSRINL